MNFAFALTKIIAKHVDRNDEVPNEEDQDWIFEDRKTLHVEQSAVLKRVMNVFVNEVVWKVSDRAALCLVISSVTGQAGWEALHWNFHLA